MITSVNSSMLAGLMSTISGEQCVKEVGSFCFDMERGPLAEEQHRLNRLFDDQEKDTKTSVCDFQVP